MYGKYSKIRTFLCLSKKMVLWGLESQIACQRCLSMPFWHATSVQFFGTLTFPQIQINPRCMMNRYAYAQKNTSSLEDLFLLPTCIMSYVEIDS